MVVRFEDTVVNVPFDVIVVGATVVVAFVNCRVNGKSK